MVVRVSLKEALRERPDAPAKASGRKESTAGRAERNLRLIKSYNTQFAVTCTSLWSAAEFRTFEFLTDMVTSPRADEREQGKKWYADFERKHGLQKCVAMLNESRRRAQQNWYASKEKGGKGVLRADADVIQHDLINLGYDPRKA